MADSSRCPDIEALDALASGRLQEPIVDRVRAHLADCDECRRTVAHLVRDSAQEPSPSPSSDPARQVDVPPLKQGSTIGRYVVIAPLGRGGMGIVYEAFDPELHRPVALKLLHERFAEAAGDAHARLQREARVLARLSHPNVVVIHDVGTWDGGVFLAMERVDGGTLRTWMAERPRSWREILAIFLDAGRGLAAAHAAGIVHRDFKPENVLIGSDGRARVTDFGLARDGTSSAAEDDLRPGTSSITNSLVGGTPAYMAPEQGAGARPDARSDQFSFSVALWEALTGERSTATAPLTSTNGIPAALRRAVARGMNAAPEDRFATLQAMLSELEAVPRRRARIRTLLVTSGLTSVVALTSLIVAGQQSRHCEGSQALLLDSWGPQQKSLAKSAVLGSGLPWAQDAWTALERNLDGWTAQWAQARTAACEATHVRREQSEEILAARFRCFEQRREELDGFIEILRGGDARVVERAVSASSNLSPLDVCGDIGALVGAEPPANDAALQKKVEALRLSLARARGPLQLGNYADAEKRMQPVVDEARALGFRPLQAEALADLADARRLTGALKASLELLAEAEWRAEAAGRDELIARIRLSRLRTLDELGRDGELGDAASGAEATIERLGNPPRLRASLELARATITSYRDETDAARAHAHTALKLVESLYGADHPDVAKVLNNLAVIERNAGNLEEASQLLDRCAAIFTSAYGERHPFVARVLSNRGALRLKANDPKGARRDLQRALRLREEALGKEHPDLGATLVYLSSALRADGALEEALPLTARALQILESAYGPDHPDVATVLEERAQVERMRRQWASSEALYRRALTIRQRVLGAEDPQTQSVRTGLEDVLRLAKSR